jgi:hypothetical protein
MISGIFSWVRFRRQRDPAWQAMDDIANTCGLPRIWLCCPHCGAQSWRLPPHVFEPCPLVIEMAQSEGLKIDAERMTAVRAGVQIETVLKAMQEALSEDEDEDE